MTAVTPARAASMTKREVHKGEFVFSKKATQNIGVNNLAYAHNMAKSGRTPSSSSTGQQGPLELSPYDRQLLSDIRDRVGISISGPALQQVSGALNVNASNRRAA